MTNLQLVASLNMLKIQAFITTPLNYRFLLSQNSSKMIYINKYSNTYVVRNSDEVYSELNPMFITADTLPMLLELINEKEKNK